MSQQKLLIPLIVLNLGACVYIAAALHSTTSPSVEKPRDTQQSSQDNSEVLIAISELKSDIEQLTRQIDERFLALETGILNTQPLLGDGQSTLARAGQAERIAAEVAESVQGEIEGKLERLASRQQNRSLGGEWKASMQELTEELQLSEAQQETATSIFDDARDGVFDILASRRDDGGSLLDDLVGDLQQGKADAFPKFIGRIFSDRAPGSEETYVGQMAQLSDEIRENLAPHLSDRQLERFRTLNVAVLEVETGYDPVAAYIEANTE